MLRASVWFIAFTLTLTGCLSPKEKPAKQSGVTVAYPDKIFPLINQKENTPAELPDSLDYTKRYSKKEVEVLSLDTTKIDANTHYYLSDQPFFSQEIEGVKAVVYYRHSYGDQLDKILRLQTPKNTAEICLAMYGGDGMDYYRQSSEFLNDSIFRTTVVTGEATRDDQDFVAYKIDSVTSDFLYDNHLNLQLLKRDTVRLTKESFYDRNQFLIKTSEGQKSRQFRVNNVPYFWNFATTFYYEPGERITAKPRFAEFAMQLTRASDGEVVLSDGDFKATDQIDVTDLRADGFVDLNLDGNKDFYNYSNQNSGSGGAFFNAYIFNPKTDKFDYSEELSGGELTMDSVSNTLSSYWKMGVGWNHQKTIHFGTKGRIRFTEDVTREVISSDSGDLMKTTYLKKIGNKVVKKTVDTTVFEGY